MKAAVKSPRELATDLKSLNINDIDEYVDQNANSFRKLGDDSILKQIYELSNSMYFPHQMENLVKSLSIFENRYMV
jgi:hypothetical protein